MAWSQSGGDRPYRNFDAIRELRQEGTVMSMKIYRPAAAGGGRPAAPVSSGEMDEQRTKEEKEEGA